MNGKEDKINGIKEVSDGEVIKRLEEILQAAKNGKLKKLIYYAVTDTEWIYEFKTGMDAFELIALLERLKHNLMVLCDDSTED